MVTRIHDNKPTAFLYLLVMTVIGVFAGLAQNKFQLQPSAQSSSFVQQTKESLEKKTENAVLFYTQVFLNRNNTRVVIPWSYDTPTAPILILGYTSTNLESRVEYLISHPQINSLNWSQIRQGDRVLFQKKKTFSSVDEFVHSLPEKNTIVVDPTLKDTYSQLKGLATTEQLFDTETIEYIFTRFAPSVAIGGVYYYENVIDASMAQINARNEIEWYIKAPLANLDNSYQLGHISVDYQQ